MGPLTCPAAVQAPRARGAGVYRLPHQAVAGPAVADADASGHTRAA
jgi:hypothetical protein